MKSKSIAIIIMILAFCPLFAGISNAMMLRLSTEYLVDQAQAVVVGYVTHTESIYSQKDEWIWTAVTLQIDSALKGEVPEQVEVLVPGGTIDDRFMFVTNHPSFEIGQTAVVFLDESLSGVFGQIQGKATIENGIVRENQLDAFDYLASIRNLAQGLEPVVDIDVPFDGVSTIDAYQNRVSPFFAYDGLHWPIHDVSVSVNENTDDCNGEGAAVKKGMQTWTDVKADFIFTYDGANSKTDVNYNGRNEAFWTSYYDGSGAIAFAAIWGGGNIIDECDLAFMEEFNWSTVDSPGHSQMDVQAIATHELGHFLCLLDLYSPSDAAKTMYGYGGYGATGARTLDEDDKDGIIHIYGPGPGVDEDSPEPPEKEDGKSTEDCENLITRIYGGCGLAVRNASGEAMASDLAMDQCDYGSYNVSWTCILNCSEQSGSCDALHNCTMEACDNALVKPGNYGGSDDDGGGGICG